MDLVPVPFQKGEHQTEPVSETWYALHAEERQGEVECNPEVLRPCEDLSTLIPYIPPIGLLGLAKLRLRLSLDQGLQFLQGRVIFQVLATGLVRRDFLQQFIQVNHAHCSRAPLDSGVAIDPLASSQFLD